MANGIVGAAERTKCFRVEKYVNLLVSLAKHGMESSAQVECSADWNGFEKQTRLYGKAHILVGDLALLRGSGGHQVTGRSPVTAFGMIPAKTIT